ncbi:MAG: AraC family transcriptional regulator, partial [Bacillota bacterium]|nr:AraC family transcriptional regulator [Bacillota bacterium]
PTNPMKRYCFRFDFDIDERFCSSYSDEEVKIFVHMLSNIHFFYSPDNYRIEQLFREINTEYAQQLIGYYSRIQHLFVLLFIAVFREISQTDQKNYNVKRSEIVVESRNNQIERFFDYNYHYKARSRELCNLINISKSQLNRILKEKYGMTFKQKHVESQIEHTKDMLLYTDWSVTRIAEEIGYNSLSGFSTFFKHIVGISPAAFRKTIRTK